jgi:hypothetical protein
MVCILRRVVCWHSKTFGYRTQLETPLIVLLDPGFVGVGGVEYARTAAGQEGSSWAGSHAASRGALCDP